MAVPVFALILTSICSSTTIILMNKQILSRFHFTFPLVLTTYHFMAGWLLNRLMIRMKLFEEACVPTFSRWWMGFFGVTSIVTMNVNLQLNSIGFYQLSKLMTIPCLVVWRWFHDGQKTHVSTMISLVWLLIGLWIFSGSDVEFNWLGAGVACVAVVTTVIYQQETNSLQKRLGITGVQLNERVALQRFVVAAIASLFIEFRVIWHEWQVIEILFILTTGLIATLGSIVGFSLIGREGAVTFQVVGHVKTLTVFVFGLLLFPPTHEPVHLKRRKIIGLVVAMGGVIVYTLLELLHKKREREAIEHPETESLLDKRTEEESDVDRRS